MMEEMASLWSYQESTEELKQKLLYTTLELESLRAEATEEMRKNKESVKQLFQLLKTACQERDEAKDQLQKILTKIMPLQNDQFYTLLPNLPLPNKANSSITESNSLSDAYNHSSSPVDSLFDPISSPEFSNFNVENSFPAPAPAPAPQMQFVHDYSTNNNNGMTKFDQGFLVIDNMVRGKVLPQKGKFLQAVLEAGPLLQTLLVAGPLPRWRNPPPLQPFHIPPVSVRGSDGGNEVGRQVMNSQSYVDMSCGNAQMLGTSTSVLSFGNGNMTGNGRMVSGVVNGGGNDYIPAGKRQRF